MRIFFFVFLSFYSVTLIAQPPVFERQPPMEQPELLDPITRKLDTDGDGEISAEEMQAAPKILTSLDKNGDGTLTINELLPEMRMQAGPEGPGGGGPGGGPGGGGVNRPVLQLTEKFDADKNGYLDPAERKKALEQVPDNPRRGGPPGMRGGAGREQMEGRPGPRVSLKDVKSYDDRTLYDPEILRTIFIQFDVDSWEEDMAKFKDTDVQMPATVIVDGKEYPMVGIKFRGQSSFGHVPAGSKRSLNLSMDFLNQDQRLLGYKTLNLLNCNGDPSLLSSILYAKVASPFLPVPQSNLVKVVINGHSWGVYANVQQYNKDFLEEFFDTTEGARWKVPGAPWAMGGLQYTGDDIEQYRSKFEIKSKDKEESWQALVDLCRVLNETSMEDLPNAIEPLLNVDGVLRFLALDVALVNSDGYWTRASDYSIYLDPQNVFHIIPHDMNEALKSGPGGGGPRGGGPRGGGPGGGFGGGFGSLFPPDFPPEFLPDDLPEFGGPGGSGGGRPRGGPGGFGGPGGGAGPGGGGPTLDPLVAIDNQRMPLRSRLLQVPQYRDKYLQYVKELALNHITVENLGPVIDHYRELVKDEIKIDTRKRTSYDAFITATTAPPENGPVSIASLFGFISQRRDFLLQHKEVAAAADIELPEYSLRKQLTGDHNIDLKISEFMANNQRTVKNPDGAFEDWIEIYNPGDDDLDLTGIYLSDRDDQLTKWKFPRGTIIKAGEYLIIWADESKSEKGLHANFKLSKSGEVIVISNGQTVIDRLEFAIQTTDVSQGRLNSKDGKLNRLTPTPAAANQKFN
ncbi:MAG: spore coat protein CotH [Planctomycetaceae bacterium]|nr:spore coat protein CotH [Planctomycetaceae bacterium]